MLCRVQTRRVHHVFRNCGRLARDPARALRAACTYATGGELIELMCSLECGGQSAQSLTDLLGAEVDQPVTRASTQTVKDDVSPHLDPPSTHTSKMTTRPTTVTRPSATAPAFEYEQVEDEGAERRWDGLESTGTIRIWNTSGQVIFIIPFEWAAQLGHSTLAHLEPVIEVLFTDQGDTPLMWLTKEEWDRSETPALLPIDEAVTATDYVIYRGSASSGLCTVSLTAQTSRPGWCHAITAERRVRLRRSRLKAAPTAREP